MLFKCPHFNGVVSEATNNLLVVILEAVHSLTVLTMAFNTGQAVPSILPVVLHGLVSWREEMRSVIFVTLTEIKENIYLSFHSTKALIKLNKLNIFTTSFLYHHCTEKMDNERRMVFHGSSDHNHSHIFWPALA